jgi:multidrug efflux pump subunit AcrA (membrane-fusion protein)
MLLQPVEIAVITLAPQSVEIALSVVGRVQSGNTLDVRSQNAGQIAQLLHGEGDVVAKGAPLAVIRGDNRP